MKKYYGLMTLLLLAASVQADEYYRSIDAAGKVHYGDSPVPSALDVEALQPKSEPSANDDSLPFETRRANEKFPVTLYVAESCGDACSQARHLFSTRGITFSENTLGTVEEIEAFRKASGNGHIPTLNIGNNWMEGFLEKQWHKELDAAGYPRVAPFGIRPALKAKPATAIPQNE